MKIIDLDEQNKNLYFVCLEDWSEEIKEAGDHKAQWFEKMKDKGVRVKFAADDNGIIGGMIQYLPVENHFVQGKDLYFIACIHVHGYKQGRGNFQKKGMGTALLGAAEQDARSLGAKGIAAWGVILPFWMKASWFKKHGYKQVDRDGISALLFKPFTPDAQPPKWNRQKKKLTAQDRTKVCVTAFKDGWCPAQNMVFERARRAALEFGEKVKFEAIDTLDSGNYGEWGITDALYIDGKKVRTGPPPSFEKIKWMIEKRVNKLK
jgi:N-acetylglutamate synthase-like GNAT family acetyltransferase